MCVCSTLPAWRATGLTIETDLILAAIDVEANYSVVLAYQYTDILSASLLNAWATPACMIVAYFLVKARYHWSQILGALICIGGLVLLIVSDFLSREGMTQGKNKPKGVCVLNFLLSEIEADE